MSTESDELKPPKTAKALLYLDAERMYSLSSQLFEGFAESRIFQSGQEEFDRERQRGPMASGRENEDGRASSTLTQERRFLHDWSYTEFEERLISEGAVQAVNAAAVGRPDSSGGFVKVSGVGGIRDVDAIIEFIRDYNKIGQSLVYVSSHKELEAAKAQAAEAAAATTDRNKRNAILQRAGAGLDLKKLAKESGLQLDDKFTEHLLHLVERWFSGHIEATLQTHDSGPEYIAPMNPSFLRQPKTLLARKYGRSPNIPLTIFGTTVPTVASLEPTEEGADNNVRAGIRAMMTVLAGVDDRVSGATSSEVMLDPIAVYVDVPRLLTSNNL